MAPITIHTSAAPSRPPSAVRTTKTNGFACFAAVSRSPMASVITMSITKPTTPETQTALTIPRGAASCAPLVSSATCAEAS